jgi:hypothetical protein
MIVGRWSRLGWLVGALLCAVPGAAARAQEHGHARGALGLTATPALTHAGPVLAGDGRTESYVSQPILLAHASVAEGRLSVVASLHLEGLTLRRGELAPGNAGEGWVDRRHPHTYAHEAMLVAAAPAGGFHLSLAAGRGFAPFGTDDPMVRPFAKYPANHHLAQVLERLVAVAAVRRGPAIVEAALFNGDEPTEPDDLGRVGRFGDSWAVRATVLPRPWLEAQASHARLESPEHALGGGLDQRKWSASARAERALSGDRTVYALVEWARTDEYSLGLRAFTFETALAELAASAARWRGALRFERTTRPEEERLLDPFRTARPHADENIVGITRWTALTARLGREVSRGGWAIEPFAEATRHAVRSTAGILFDPVEHYGDDRLWTLTVGARIGLGAQHQRMGRYGAAVPAPPAEVARRAAEPAAHEHGMER